MAEYSIGFDKIGIDLSKVNSTGYSVCPTCSLDRKQSNKNNKVLKVYKETGYYNCNHCAFKGRVDSNEWIERQHGLETGLIVAKNHNEGQLIPIKPFHITPLNAECLEFLQQRGISKETAEACRVQQNANCLVFNYYKGEKIVGAKYRKIDTKFFWQHAGCEKYLYGLNDIEDQETIILVEGEMDKLSFYEAGIKNCVSISQGAPNVGSEVGGKLKCLENSIDYIKKAKKVILACDNDANGQYLTKVLIERFGADRCATVEFPIGCKDANDVLINLGADALKKIIQEAKETPIAGVKMVNQVRDNLLDIYQNGFRKGVNTGIKELDGHFSFYKPWLNLFYGIPNSGKSAYVLFLMMSMAVHHGWKWACFVPEAYPAEDFYIDCVKVLTGRGIENTDSNKLPIEEYNAALDFIHEHFFFVYPEDDANSKGDYMLNNCDNLIDKIKELKLSKNIDGFLIDPFNQMSKSSDEKGTTIDSHLEETLGKIDRLSKTHNLSGNIIAHPRTMYRDKDTVDYRKPTPYEIAGGAMWYNKGYTITCVHRPFNQSDKNNKLVEIDIQKIKSHKRAGWPAIIDFIFDPKTEWYLNPNGSVQFSSLYGEFDKILTLKGIEQKSTFKSKLEKEKLPLDPWGDEVPF